MLLKGRLHMSYIIKSPEELKDPFLCTCIFNRFDEVAGEDYLDYNEFIVNGYNLLFWMYGKGFIDNDQLEKYINSDMRSIGNQELNYISAMEILQSDILFPKTYGQSRYTFIKGYSIFGEFMSSCKEFRQRIWDSVHDKATSFQDDEFYMDENGVSLACIIEDDDMISRCSYTKEMIESLKPGELYNLSFRERYDFVKSLSIQEADCLEDNW